MFLWNISINTFILYCIFYFNSIRYFNSIDLQKYNLTFLIILATSLGTTIFFIIKIYIENQLGIKEKIMTKEYETKLNEVKNELKENQNKNFNEVKNELKKIKIKTLMNKSACTK